MFLGMVPFFTPIFFKDFMSAENMDDDIFDVINVNPVTLEKQRTSLPEVSRKAYISKKDVTSKLPSDNFSPEHSHSSESELDSELDSNSDGESHSDNKDDKDDEKNIPRSTPAIKEDKYKNDRVTEYENANPSHNILSTPRFDPSPYDPPSKVPEINRDQMLSAFRRVRDAYLSEVASHEESKSALEELRDKINLCKELGDHRLQKLTKVRLRQDEVIKNWKELEKVHRAKKKEVHRDVGELVQELRELKHQLEYEESQLADEQRRLDKSDDAMVVKENELRTLIRDVGALSKDNQHMHKTEESLKRALKTTTDVAEKGEIELESCTTEFGMTEVDAHMLQRQVQQVSLVASLGHKTHTNNVFGVVVCTYLERVV